MKKNTISFILNCIIFLFVLIGCIFMFTGFEFMGHEELLVSTKFEMFKFFTVDSNILMGVCALIFGFYDYKVITRKIKEIPSMIYLLKLVSTVGVALTFVVTAFYLAPISKNGYFTLFRNSNLFFHFIVPFLSVITFVFFDNTTKIKFKHNFLSLIPFLLYSIFYLGDIIIHWNGGVSPKYDWYYFAQGSIFSIIVVAISISLVVYLISLLLYFFNKKALVTK